MIAEVTQAMEELAASAEEANAGAEQVALSVSRVSEGHTLYRVRRRA